MKLTIADLSTAHLIALVHAAATVRENYDAHDAEEARDFDFLDCTLRDYVIEHPDSFPFAKSLSDAVIAGLAWEALELIKADPALLSRKR